MGSKRKKAQKQKDFVKPKLRVGKTAVKPANHTDTSFVAKAISLPGQSLNTKVATSKLETKKQEEINLSHQLSLTKHHALSTRKEVLASIEAHLPSNPSLYKQVMTTVTPLMLDPSRGVRAALVLLLEACATKQKALMELHVRSLVLYIHLAMTHIGPDIRNDATRFLAVVVKHAPTALARMHFIKTLKSFFTILAWTLTTDKRAVSIAVTTSSAIGGPTKKARIGHLEVLTQLLEASLFEPKQLADAGDTVESIHPQTLMHMTPTIPQAYSGLNLFGTPMMRPRSVANPDGSHDNEDGKFSIRDLDTMTTEDLSIRRKVTVDVFLGPMKRNLDNLVREGGEIGRAAHSCLRVLSKLESEESSGTTDTT